jgi:hypothetical protein
MTMHPAERDAFSPTWMWDGLRLGLEQDPEGRSWENTEHGPLRELRAKTPL